MAYFQMAYLYDRLMEEAPYKKWYTITEEILRLTGEKVETIADLGCGTGEITLKMAEAGYNLYGVDYSADMLAVAAEKSFQKNVNIQWINQDIRELSGLSNIDLAISYCDVINYITKIEEVKNTFQNVAQILRPGGLFIFDVHSMYHVEQNLTNKTFADVGEDYSYIWFCDPGDEQGEMFHHLTFFTLVGEKYERFVELHHQQTYPVHKYEQLLLETGFEKPKLYADFNIKDEFITEKAERIFFLTRKK